MPVARRQRPAGRDRPAHRCHDLTTLPHTAQPEDLEVEEPAPAGSYSDSLVITVNY